MSIVLRDTDSFDGIGDVVVTVGTMDGVHLGHVAIVNEVVSFGRKENRQSVVVTFDPHPREIVHGDSVRLLTTIEERTDLLKKHGVDVIFVLKFNKHIASLGPEAFINEILLKKFSISRTVVGYDHGFGRDRQGDASVLRTLGENHGFEVTEVPERTVSGEAISSTRIRSLIAETGDVSDAARLLGRHYSLSGEVIRGDGRGRTIGYPTANIDLHPRKLVPARGVYAVDVKIETGKHMGMMNIGTRPTFGREGLVAEVHLINFSGDLYGDTIQVDFLKRLRDEQKFESVEDLKRQLSEDKDRCIDAHSALIEDN